MTRQLISVPRQASEPINADDLQGSNRAEIIASLPNSSPFRRLVLPPHPRRGSLPLPQAAQLPRVFLFLCGDFAGGFFQFLLDSADILVHIDDLFPGDLLIDELVLGEKELGPAVRAVLGSLVDDRLAVGASLNGHLHYF